MSDYNDFALHINWDTVGNTLELQMVGFYIKKNLKGLKAVVVPTVDLFQLMLTTPPT
jgi:hypothetical protein